MQQATTPPLMGKIMTIEQVAYEEGYNSFWDSKKNPYKRDTDLYKQFNNGYDDACEDNLPPHSD